MTRWLLNSAVLAAGEYGTYRYSPATREALATFIRQGQRDRNLVSRIGYSETAEIIQGWTGYLPPPSRETSALQLGDVAMVVRLRYRVDPATKGQPRPRSDEDWEIGRLERIIGVRAAKETEKEKP